MMDEFIGKQFDGYQVLTRIGRGGMATVYLAVQTSMNRQVAIKLLPRDQMKDDTYLQRFEREVAVVARLEHRNIVPVYDHGTYDGQPYIVMRYMNGGSVDDLLRNGPLEPEQYRAIISQIAPALDFAHSRNILHRDLKPGNVLMDDDGGTYITDFGIARIVGSEGQGNTITTQGVVGTPSYMSPEQAQGQPLDGRSDVYALGVMLFEMATGRRPFHSETPYSIAVMQVTTQPPPPRSINPKISSAVEQVILKALQKKPEQRYQTAEALAESLRRAIDNPVDFTTHETHRPPQRQGGSGITQETQPGAALSGSTVPSQPHPQPAPPPAAFQPPAPYPMQPTPQTPQPLPPPGALYAPPTGVGSSVPVRPGTGPRQRRVREQSGSPWGLVALGVLIGCGLLTVVVVLLAMMVNTILNSGSDSTPPEGTTATTEASTGDAASGETDSDPKAQPDDPAATRDTSTLPETGSLPITPAAPVDPRSGRLIYFAYRGEDAELYRLDLDTGEEWQLTSDRSENQYPAPSPDGAWIAFQSNRDGDFDLYLVNPGGGSLKKVLNNTVDDLMPVWSPDGAWLAFASDTRGDGAYDLFIVRPDGSDLRQVLTNGRRNHHPRWSPDGLRLVFVTGEPLNAATWEIAVLDLAEQRVRMLTDNEVRDAWADFTPDGTAVIYVTGSGDTMQLVRQPVNQADSDPTVIYANEQNLYLWSPRYSADGSYLLFNAVAMEVATSNLYLLSADGTDLRKVNALDAIAAWWIG